MIFLDIKNIKDKRIVAIYVVVALLLVLGLTYALVTSDILFNLTTGTVAIDDTAYGETTFDNSNLDMVPILDSEVESKTDNVIKIDFKVGGKSTNNNQNIIYDIALNDLKVNCKLLSPYVKWKLVKNGTSISNGSLDYKFDTIDQYGRLVLTDIQQDLPAYSSSQTGYDSYTFYMWLSDSCQNSDIGKCTSSTDQSSLMGQSISGKVEVELYTEGKKELTRKPSSSASSSMCSDHYLIHYNVNGGTLTESEDKYVVSGSTISDLPTPTKSNTVVFNTNGGSNVASVNYIEEQNNHFLENSNSKVKLLADENKKVINYTFDGWYLDENFSNKVTSSTVINTNKTLELYAKWSGDSNITLPSTTKSGYKFFGWYGDSNYNIKIGNAGDNYSVNSNVSLYGKWGKISTVTLRTINNLMSSSDYTSSNKISLTGSSNDTYQYYDNIVVYLEAGREYYAYGESDGTWTTEHPTSSGSSTAVGFWVYNAENNAHYLIPVNTGSFTVNYTGMYKLRLNVYQSGVTHQFWNFGVRPVDTTIQVVEGEKYSSLPSSVSLPGYDFTGWYTGSVNGDKVTNGTDVTATSDHTLYARWNAKTVQVTYDANDNMFSSTTQTVGSLNITYEEKLDGNYLTLNGTYTDSANLMDYPIVFPEGKNVVTTLTYVSGSYVEGSLSRWVTEITDINFSNLSTRNNADVVMPTESSPTSRESFTTSSLAASSGKYLRVWLYSSTAGTLVFNNYKIKVDIRVSDTLTTTLNQKPGDNYSLPGSNPTRIGYDFDGWYSDANGGSAITSSSVISVPVDHKIYAHWKKKNVTVNFTKQYFSSADSLSADSVAVPYGTTYSVSNNNLVFSNGQTVSASYPGVSSGKCNFKSIDWGSSSGMVTSSQSINVKINALCSAKVTSSQYPNKFDEIRLGSSNNDYVSSSGTTSSSFLFSYGTVFSIYVYVRVNNNSNVSSTSSAVFLGFDIKRVDNSMYYRCINSYCSSRNWTSSSNYKKLYFRGEKLDINSVLYSSVNLVAVWDTSGWSQGISTTNVPSACSSYISDSGKKTFLPYYPGYKGNASSTFNITVKSGKVCYVSSLSSTSGSYCVSYSANSCLRVSSSSTSYGYGYVYFYQPSNSTSITVVPRWRYYEVKSGKSNTNSILYGYSVYTGGTSTSTTTTKTTSGYSLRDYSK